jgi:[ribosomal protein S5]-alanine N-acetyltransferase
MLIQSNDFLLRELKKSDAKSVAKHANNYKIKRYLTDSFPHPYTPQDFLAFYELCNSANDLVCAVETNGEAAGIISLSLKKGMEKPSAEIGYWLGEKYWGKGIMARAIKEMVKYGFENYNYLNKVFAHIYDFNTNSQKAIEKAGFYKNTVFKEHIVAEKKLRDVFFYELFRKDYEASYKL